MFPSLNQFNDAETTQVLNLFAYHFHGRKKIVLYGLGRHTESILNSFPDADVIGIMAEHRDSGEQWGKPFLSYEMVEQLLPTIVIVARRAVLPLIYQRIRFLESSGVSIFSLNGKQLCENIPHHNPPNFFFHSLGKEELLQKLESFSHISFDFFDTLAMRRILFPKQVFILLQQQLQRIFQAEDNHANYFIENFPELRGEYSRPEYLSLTLDSIYTSLQKVHGFPQKWIPLCCDIETQLEKHLLIARQDMLDILRQSVRKRLYVLSDTHHTRQFIQDFLRDHQVFIPDEQIIVSCESSFSKESGEMFPFFLEHFHLNPSDCLHVGDNSLSDIHQAEKYGLSTFQVFSSYELLLHSSMQQFLNCQQKESLGIVAGAFTSTVLNSPFALHKTQGIVRIESFYSLGRHFIAPLVLHWLFWLIRELQTHPAELILFSSRDGYIFQRAYCLLREKITFLQMSLPPSIYLLTSRRACTIASIQQREDIVDLANQPFQGSMRDFFRTKFDMNVDSDVVFDMNIFYNDWLDQYEEIILNAAREERFEYLRYLRRMIPQDASCIFFDFIAAGTVQHHLEKILGKTFHGCYFATNQTSANPLPIRVTSPFQIDSFSSNDDLSTIYLKLECIFSDPNSTLVKFLAEQPFFEGNGLNPEYSSLLEIHAGILEGVSAHDFSNFGCDACLEEALTLASCAFDKGCIVSNRIKDFFFHDDMFINKQVEKLWL